LYNTSRSKFYFVLLLLTVLLISGCGSSTALVEQSAKNTAADSEVQAATVDASKQVTSTRIYRDASMDVEIPAAPIRIAVLLDYFSDQLLELGLKPYAATTTLVNDQFLPYLADQMEGVIPLGSSESPNLEALLEAEPDLIIAFAPSHENIADSLRKIAPTVFISSEIQSDWRLMLLEFGKIVDKEQLAQQKLDQYLLKAENAKKELDQRASEEVFVVMRVMPKELRVYGVDDIRIGRIIHQELGLNGLKLDGNKAMLPISFEELPNLNPDHIFLMENVEDVAKSRIDEIKGSAIWKGLKAVQEDHIYTVEQQLWIRGVAPIGANKIIDQVLELVK
jgi:iron complex transport system substrate-binding protein